MPSVTALRTICIAERANLLWLEIETDEGLTGLGESFRGAQAVEAVVHEQVAPYLLGKDARNIEGVSHHLMNPYVGFGSSSAEIRAASAVDMALWDLMGQRHGVPMYVALGGAVRDSIRVYNTCAGYSYNTSGARRAIGNDDATAGPYDDQIAFTRDAGALAESLLSEGYTAMKIWPFDVYSDASGGHMISLSDLNAGLEPFRKVRRAVGNRIDVMCEMHSLWTSHAAIRICRALEEFNVFWAEDPIGKMNDVAALADLRRQTRTPICASETLGGVVPFRDLLAGDAVDVVMLDLSWCGGMTQARKIAALAEAYARPLAPHDCTGPVALMAGLHLALHAPTAIFQEVVRAALSTWYRELVTSLPEIRDGMALAPQGTGLCTKLDPAVVRREDATVRVSGTPRR
jgi:L-alanine-DL-glutamate epimerase-like enolase superfamily enzyme